MRACGDSSASFTSRRARRAPASPVLPEQAFAAIFEEALDVILLIDPSSGEIVQVNHAVERHLGYSPAHVTGRHFSILFPHDAWSTPDELLVELRARGPQLGVQEFQHADGSTLCMDLRATVVACGESRQILVATLRDASDSVQAREEHRALLDVATAAGRGEPIAVTVRRAAELVSADAAAVVYWDAHGETYRLLAQLGAGIDADAARAFPLGAIFGGRLAGGETVVVERREDWGPHEQAVMAGFRHGVLVAVPLLLRGRVRGAFMAGNPHSRPFGAEQVRHLDRIAPALTLAIEAGAFDRPPEEEVQRASASLRLAEALVSAPATPRGYDDLCRTTTATLGADVGSSFLWVAREGVYAAVASHGGTAEAAEALRVLRFTPEMTAALLTPRTPAEWVRLEDLAPDDPVRQALVGAQRLVDALFIVLRRGGEVIGFHCAGLQRPGARFGAHHQRLAQGVAPIAALALEHARLSEQLERANRVKADFAGTMSHELRTPLNAIIGYHDLLLEGEFGDLTAAQAERVRLADQSARELRDLINTTLDVSRLERRCIPLHVEDVDLRALVQTLDAEVAAWCSKPGVRVAWRLSAAPPSVRTDPSKLKVVLKNLIHNALKFTDSGEVTVAIGAGGGRIEFEIADSGIGIAPDLLPVIFEPFRQADSSSTRSYGGVGLGLYVVQRLLDLLGGGVTVESDIGRGSRFRVWLPIDQP